MAKNIKLGLFTLLFLNFITCFSQNETAHFIFKNCDTIPVKDKNNVFYKNPWAGGLNTPQFSQIDLNNDGKKDLFIFERNGNRILTYINTANLKNQISYTYSNAYSNSFPKMHDWTLLRDYDGDGKEDIFTYSNGGIAVYKNISDSSGLKFKQITESILADFGFGTSTNLYVASTDIPAIADIDNDGDLDILTFHILGRYLQAYINKSVEHSGNSDSLRFVLENNCWGNFEESATANHVTLNIDCPYNKKLNYLMDKKLRHTGSTICALNLDGDYYKDVLIGDIDYRNIVALYSDTLGAFAKAYKMDAAFPAYDTTVNITAMPAIYSIDMDNDSLDDLIIAPNDTRISDNYSGVWLYKNNGAKTNAFKLSEKGFLQNDMIDVGQSSYPVLYDYNKDGLTDLIVGNYGIYSGSKDSLSTIYSTYISTLSMFKNIGTLSNPSFQLIDPDFANLSALKLTSLHPTFADINNDGKDEMLVGQQNGKLIYFENNATDNESPAYNIVNSNYMDIDAGSNSSPQWIDIDKDGLIDICVGSKDGTIKFYRNTGTHSMPRFLSTPTISKLGNINVTDTLNSNYGYSNPCFIQKEGKLCLFVGSQSGDIFYYQDLNQNLNGDFTQVDKMLFGSNNGMYSAVALADLNNDGFFDAITGNEAGGLSCYIGGKPWNIGISETIKSGACVFPNPASTEIKIRGENIEFVEISNIQGALIQWGKANKLNTYNISQLNPGLYIIKVTFQDKHIEYARFIKAN